jgi:arsenite/tail-anchored protein-transporting ATPase
MDINVRNVVVNQLMDPDEKDVPMAVRTRSAMQEKYIDQLAELYPGEDYHVVRLPLLPAEVRGIDALREFGAIACDPKRTL